MKKTIAVVALVAAAFAAPVLPVQAAPAASNANCLVLPLLQADCRAEMREHAASHHAAVKASAKAHKWPVPTLWNCERAPAGSGHLLDCK